jgi:hypothetical protein
VTVLLALAAPTPALAAFEISDFSVSPASAPAGSHPSPTVSMTFGGDATDDVKDIIQHFPAGVIPNPEALPRCSPADLAADTCPPASLLGSTSLTATPDAPLSLPVTLNGDVFNIEVDPPNVGGLGFVVRPAPGVHSSLAAPFTVRTARHDITTSLPDIKPEVGSDPLPPAARDNGLTGLSVNVPRDVDLSGLGAVPIKVNSIQYTLNGIAQSTGIPYITTTTGCLQGWPMLEATSWDAPDTRVSRLGNLLTSTDCEDVPFDPLPFDVVLENTTTDAPSGYDISVNMPAGEVPLHRSYLKRSQTTLPEGTALSAAAGAGLEGCTDEQLGIGSNSPPACPPGSDIGDVTVESKNVPDPLHGDFFLGRPTPSDTFRVFIAFPIVDGLWVKLDGTSVPDPVTGRVTTVFDKLPMLPFEKLTISLEGGDHAVLVNPAACGTHTVTSTLTPWKSAPAYPPADDAHPEGSFATSYDGQGGACPPSRPFDPAGTASTAPTQAGAATNLAMGFSNPDRNQLLRTLRTSLPPGLVGRLTGVSLCARAAAAVGSCDAASRIGGVNTLVGAGASPLSLAGSIYIAEPLMPGDPASLSVVVPARVGPFDFGNVVTRVRIVLRRDAGLDVELADELPRIVAGVPIRVRGVSVNVDRPDFTFNPTSCSQREFSATFSSYENADRSGSTPFQASGCDALAFTPKLRFVAEGQLRKDGHPGLRAIVTQPPGQANIARSRVVLPDVIRPEVLALQRPGGLCQEAQLAARACPAGSRVGTARATTPLLPEPLSGPVYIVQHAANPLPKLVVLLEGMVAIQLEAQNGLERLRIVNTFDGLPDVPVSQFELAIRGGSSGILKNYANLCEKRVLGEAAFTAHSGKTATSKPEIEVPACLSANSQYRPRASITLSRLVTGKPVLRLRVRRANGAARLRELRLTLPRSLRADPRSARRGAVVRGTRKLRRSQWRLTRSGVLKVRLRAAGATTITAVVGEGALRPTGALRAQAKARPRLRFRLRVTDVLKRRFTVTQRVRPRS